MMVKKREKLSEARKSQGLSRVQLADLVGVSKEHIRSLEYGRVRPSIPVMFKISRVLQKDPEWLFEDVTKM
ncbi:helix-turn-helix domain-containing protein [Brevibacillus borstelensis]|uniref:helix-turn-helix transcriptional regulator n=1 Tax=Brevibacillus borstelensis TaxID=45462 RepID=UPI0006904E7E